MDGTEGVWSEVLGLYLCHRGRGTLGCTIPGCRTDLATPREQPAARQAAEVRAAGEAAARRAAEARIEELEALLSPRTMTGAAASDAGERSP